MGPILHGFIHFADRTPRGANENGHFIGLRFVDKLLWLLLVFIITKRFIKYCDSIISRTGSTNL